MPDLRARGRARAAAWLRHWGQLLPLLASTFIDFVGSRSGRGFESKYVDGAWRGESRTLAARGQGGVVATRSVLALDEDMIAVPTGLLVHLLGA